MADITQLRFAQQVKKLLGLKTSDPGRVISPIVAPTFELQDTYRPESRAPRGERLMTLATTANVVAATSFQFLRIISPSNGRLFVFRRLTITFQMPTAANFPGIAYLFIGAPQLNNGAFTATVFGQYKDNRNTTGAINQTSTGYLPTTQGAVAAGTIFNNSVYFELLNPQATVGVYRNQVTDVDVVMPPNSQLGVGIGSDTLPVGSFSYALCLEGYEYVPDPAEQLAPLT